MVYSLPWAAGFSSNNRYYFDRKLVLLRAQAKKVPFRAYVEYPFIRNAWSFFASSLAFNNAAGTQPISATLILLDRSLNSTSVFVDFVDLSVIFILFRNKNASFCHHFFIASGSEINNSAGTQLETTLFIPFYRPLNSTSTTDIISTVSWYSYEHRPRNCHFALMSNIPS